MARLELAPPYDELFRRLGLAAVADFLALRGVLLGSHPGRNTLRVELGGATFILKRETRVPWRDRFASAWAGHGWCSKSLHEARVLREMRAAGVGCPAVAACGEDGRRAFLLLREESGLTELRALLAGWSMTREGEAPAEPSGAPTPPANPARQGGGDGSLHPRPDGRGSPRSAGASPSRGELRALAVALGREVARIHATGCCHRDLYAKHVLVGREAGAFRFGLLDWQRCHRPARLGWRHRLHDLATLDASLAEALVSERLRLACLRAYLDEVADAPPLRRATVEVRRRCEVLLRRRRVRALRQPPLPAGAQELLWLDDDNRLSVSARLRGPGGELPDWVPTDPAPRPGGDHVEVLDVPLPWEGAGRLVRRWRGAGRAVGGRFPAPEIEAASTLFALERFGVRAPRVLALGHRALPSGQHFSFLAAEAPRAVRPLRDGLGELPFTVLADAGRTLRRVHEAGYTFSAADAVLAAWGVDAAGRVVVTDVGHLGRTAAGPDALARADLPRLFAGTTDRLSRADVRAFIAGYWSAVRDREHRLGRRVVR